MPEPVKPLRRVAGRHDYRLDGLTDLLTRATGATVMDIGCNRGAVGLEFARNGARLIHGVDNYAQGIGVAREVFADIPDVDSRFEVVDLSRGASSLSPFGRGGWDIVVMLATYHKLKRVMADDALSELVRYLGTRTIRYFAWRGTSGDTDEQFAENEQEMAALDRDLMAVKLERKHTSYISAQLGVAAIWQRV